MAITLTAGALTATTATLNVAGSNGGSIQVQLSSSDRFAFVPSPIYLFGNGGALNLANLNQRATYYARARNFANGAATSVWGPTIGFRTQDGVAQATLPANVMIDLAMVVRPEPILAIAGSADDGFPLANLTDDAPVAWKASGQASQVLTVTHAGAPFDTIALLNTNVGEAGTITIADGATQLYSGPFRASANLPGRRGYHCLARFAPSTARVVTITIAGGLPNNMIYAEHLVLGRNRVTKNHAVEKTETPLPKTSIERGRSGIPDRLDGLAMRKVEFDIAMMTEQQYETAYGDLVYAENEPFLVVPNSKSGAFLHDRILFGDLKGSRIFNPNTPRFTRTFVTESLI